VSPKAKRMKKKNGYFRRLDYFDAFDKGQMAKALFDRVERFVIVVQIELVCLFLYSFEQFNSSHLYIYYSNAKSHLALQLDQCHVLVRMHVPYDSHVLNGLT